MEMSKVLNNHYCRTFTREDLSQVDSMVNVVFTREEVKKKLMELRPDSAPDPDRVRTKVLQISSWLPCQSSLQSLWREEKYHRSGRMP